MSETEGRRACKCCGGTGIRVREAFTYEGKTYPERRYECNPCGGTGYFDPPDFPAILAAIKGRKGLRSTRPKDGRAYYVWRLARFHGGADMTMPVMAGVETHGDPFRPELDRFADTVATQFFGSDKAAARRWGRALGFDIPTEG